VIREQFISIKGLCYILKLDENGHVINRVKSGIVMLDLKQVSLIMEGESEEWSTIVLKSGETLEVKVNAFELKDKHARFVDKLLG
jgi:hypothetical protein